MVGQLTGELLEGDGGGEGEGDDTSMIHIDSISIDTCVKFLSSSSMGVPEWCTCTDTDSGYGRVRSMEGKRQNNLDWAG